MKKIIILRTLFLTLLIATLIIIFGFSNQNGEVSGSISRKIAETIVNIFNKNSDNISNTIIQAERIIRKLAHFSIYTSVGIWTMSFISTFKIKETNKVIFSTLTGFIYACTDEFHQSFIKGRAASFLDVTIDTLGVIFGMLLVSLIIKIYKEYYKNITTTLKKSNNKHFG